MARGRPKGEGSLVTRSSDGRLGAYITLPDTGGKRVYDWCPKDDNTPRRQEQVRRALLNRRDANRLTADARQTLSAYLATWLVSRPDGRRLPATATERASSGTSLRRWGRSPWPI